MGVDPKLLTKAAKVYEAAESLDGEKPKTVYESHKKCAPGEFGMNKEGSNALRNAIAKAAHQKQGTDLYNALFGPDVFTPGRSAMMGAGVGGVAGAGLGGVLGGLYGLADPGNESVYASDGHVKGLKRRSRLMGALRGLAGGGALGAGAGAAVGGGVGYVNADLLEDARRRGEFENLMNRG